MNNYQAPVEMVSISMWHQFRGLNKPTHPLISVINLIDLKAEKHLKRSCYSDFYTFVIKKSTEKNARHSQQKALLSAGVMTFFKPGQLLIIDNDGQMPAEGQALMMHPDFIRSSGLDKFIDESRLLTNGSEQVLTLSEGEENLLIGIFKKIEEGLRSAIDEYTLGHILSMMELLLNYCNRFNKHMVINKISIRNDMLDKMEVFLSDYFDSDELPKYGMPTVQHIAERLNISPNYLSDILRDRTGQSTKQHIQDKLIRKAKEILLMTNLTVNEVAYLLGFEYPQSFGKLFKKRTGKTPLAFKQHLNHTDCYLEWQN